MASSGNRKRLHLIANTRSGRGVGAKLPEIAQKVCDEFNAELVTYDTSKNFNEVCGKAVEAAKKDGGVVVAAGGDGTIRGVAQKAAGQTVDFGVVPVGTFNFFARNHQIPEDPEEAFRLIFTGEVRTVRLGRVNNEIFLINASLGLYAKAIREREQSTARFGRYRFVVIVSTIISFFRRHRLLNVDLVMGNERRSLRTPMIFIGNNALQLRDLKMDVARCMKKDLMAAVTLKPLRKMEMVRVLFRGLTKTIEQEENVDSFCVDSLTIHTTKSPQMVALDGEIFHLNSPFKVEALPHILRMVLPPKVKAP